MNQSACSLPNKLIKRTMKLCMVILISNFFVNDGQGSAFPCQYSYTNLPHSLTLEANAEAGQPIYNVTIGYTVGGPAPKTVDLKNPSEYFAIENNVVMVNSCLPAPGPSNAIIHLEIQIVGEEINCPSEYLSITVDFAVPDFNFPAGVVVDVDMCTIEAELEVHQIQFNNDDHCNITFTCFVNNTDGENPFKMDSGNTVTTAAEDIVFNLIYTLNITCYDSRASLPTTDPTSRTLDVTFLNISSCTLTETSTATIRFTSHSVLASVITSSEETYSLISTFSSETTKFSTLITTVTTPTEIKGSSTTVIISPEASVVRLFTTVTRALMTIVTSPATTSPILFSSLSAALLPSTTTPTTPDVSFGGLPTPAIVAISSVGGIATAAVLGSIGACIYKSTAGQSSSAVISGNS